jgi:hypothetical protein
MGSRLAQFCSRVLIFLGFDNGGRARDSTSWVLPHSQLRRVGRGGLQVTFAKLQLGFDGLLVGVAACGLLICAVQFGISVSSSASSSFMSLSNTRSCQFVVYAARLPVPFTVQVGISAVGPVRFYISVRRSLHLCQFVIVPVSAARSLPVCSASFLSTGGQIAAMPGKSRSQMAGQRRFHALNPVHATNRGVGFDVAAKVHAILGPETEGCSLFLRRIPLSGHFSQRTPSSQPL